MKIIKKTSKGLKRVFNLSFSNEEISEKIDLKLKEIGSSARIPGFRPGKVPVSIIKSRIGKEITNEVINNAVEDATKKVISDEKIRPVMKPLIDIQDYQEGTELKASIQMEVMPKISPIDLSKIKIEKQISSVSENEIKEALGRLAKQNQTTKKVETKRKSKMNDTLVIDFEGKMDGVPFEGGAGKDYHLSLGSNSFIPGFEEGLVGLNAGDSKSLKLRFPKDYGMKKLEGKEVIFDVKVNEIRESEKIKIDDQFAKNLGMESLKELRNAISTQIEKDHDAASRLKLKKKLLDVLDESHSFDLPLGMIDEEYKSVCSSLNKKNDHDHDHDHIKTLPDEGMTKSQKTDAKEIAVRRVKLGLLMGEIGRLNSLEVSEEDINKAILQESQKYPGQEKQVLEFYKNNKEASQKIAGPIFEEKVVDFIFEMASIKEVKVDVKTLYKEEPDKKIKKNKQNSKVSKK